MAPPEILHDALSQEINFDTIITVDVTDESEIAYYGYQDPNSPATIFLNENDQSNVSFTRSFVKSGLNEYNVFATDIFGNTSKELIQYECLDYDGDGYNYTSDCDDYNNLIFPGADDPCDGIDNDCDGIDNCDALILDMIILLDRSGSMGSFGYNWWPDTIEAIKTFFNYQFTTNFWAGINAFPPISGDQCSPNAYVTGCTPLEIIPPNASTLITAVNDFPEPMGDTPTYYAMMGTFEYAMAHFDPNHEGIIVLVTDGEPNECITQDIPSLAALAGQFYYGYGIRTYVIGLGTGVASKFDPVAQAGGTITAIEVSSNISYSLFDELLNIYTQASSGM